MKPEERLFSAIGGADEGLLTRSERAGERKRAWIRTGRYLVTAACLVLAAGVWLWSASITGYLPGSGRDLPAEPAPVPVPVEAPQLEEAAGTFLVVGSLDESGVQGMLSYSYYLDDTYHCSTFRYAGGIYIQPEAMVMDGAPSCQVGIHHLPECTLEEAVEIRKAENERAYRTVTLLDEDSTDLARAWPERAVKRCLISSDGTAAYDRQAEDWFFDDGQGGFFVLCSHYFTEAAEGWGTWLYKLICSFRPETADRPAWQSGLEEAVRQIAEAAFAGELAEGSPLLTEEGRLYLEELEPGEARVTQYTCGIKGQDGEFTGSAEVTCLMDGKEPGRILGIGLRYEDGCWLADWVSLRDKDRRIICYAPA